MQTNETRVWFPAKKYGWGWGPPCAWQGWVVFAIWLALLGGGAVFLTVQNAALYGAYAMVISLGLFMLLLAKGEKPRWRWGDDGNRHTRSSADRLAELEKLRRQRLVSESEYEAKRREILREV
jgi:hypothetical protein